MSIATFFGVSAVLWILAIVAGLVGVVIYLKRRGVLAQAATAAKTAVEADVQNAADKLTK